MTFPLRLQIRRHLAAPIASDRRSQSTMRCIASFVVIRNLPTPLRLATKSHEDCRLAKTSERLLVKKKDQVLQELPLRRLRTILVNARGVSFSSALIEHCASFSVEVLFLDFRERIIHRLSSPAQHQTIESMRGQFRAMDSETGFLFARQMVIEKLEAQRRVINYHKRRAESSEIIETYLSSERASRESLKTKEALQTALAVGWTQSRRTWMGIEGAAARQYWAALRSTIDERARFERRESQGAEDLVNSMLNYGYALLESRVWTAVERAGLHPYGGFLHADRPGKHSLVLDLMEPWRCIIDDAVFSIISRSKSRLPASFDSRFRKDLLREVINRFNSIRDYNGKTLPVRECMIESARNLGVFFRDDGDLKPFRWDVRGPKKPREEQS